VIGRPRQPKLRMRLVGEILYAVYLREMTWECGIIIKRYLRHVVFEVDEAEKIASQFIGLSMSRETNQRPPTGRRSIRFERGTKRAVLTWFVLILAALSFYSIKLGAVNYVMSFE
jgi:hypothetical protein